jgi:hypothetical protein
MMSDEQTQGLLRYFAMQQDAEPASDAPDGPSLEPLDDQHQEHRRDHA